MTRLEKKLLIKTFAKCHRNLNDDMADYLKGLLAELKAEDFKEPFDFEGAAKDFFLHNLKTYYEHHFSLESAVQSFKHIINSRK